MLGEEKNHFQLNCSVLSATAITSGSLEPVIISHNFKGVKGINLHVSGIEKRETGEPHLQNPNLWVREPKKYFFYAF